MKRAIGDLSGWISTTQKEYSVQELEQLALQQPYSAAVQLLLTQRQLQTDATALAGQDKASLFFPSPLWLDHLLQDTGDATIQAAKKERVEETPVNKIVIAPQTVEDSVALTEDDDAIPTLDLENKKEDTHIPGVHEPVAVVDEPEVLPQNDIAPIVSDPGSVNSTGLAPVDEQNPADSEEIVEEANVPLPQFKMPDFTITPVDATANELVFEPYHTVDYFASQGIKFREEEKPRDKFGIQLKSFTEWLKTLKKAPGSESSTAPVNANLEKKVEQMAEHSVEDRDVVTEAMAEVWEKQGNRQKAIAVYKKLSLLNPSKSAYFAGLIEQLKNS